MISAFPSRSIKTVGGTPSGFRYLGPPTQGSSFLATLGWRTQSLWDWKALGILFLHGTPVGAAFSDSFSVEESSLLTIRCFGFWRGRFEEDFVFFEGLKHFGAFLDPIGQAGFGGEIARLVDGGNGVGKFAGAGLSGSQGRQHGCLGPTGQFTGLGCHAQCLFDVSDFGMRVGCENPSEAIEGLWEIGLEKQGGGILPHCGEIGRASCRESG